MREEGRQESPDLNCIFANILTLYPKGGRERKEDRRRAPYFLIYFTREEGKKKKEKKRENKENPTPSQSYEGDR